MKVFTIFVFSFLPQSLFSINVENNVCPKLEFYPLAAVNDQCYVNPDILSSVEDIAKRHGYYFENFTVTTDDGYILNLFHISRKVNGTKKYLVFLQHGITSNSGTWVHTPNKSIAFYLADRGYQVWLGNPRGTTYSTRHKTLSIRDRRYWGFNLDTLMEKDLRIQLKFVAEKTKQKIHYIGHSMGTTLIAMFLSAFPEEANKWIQSASLLAPVVYFNPKMVTFFQIPLLGTRLLSFIGIDGLFYHENPIHKTLMKTCQSFPHVCVAFINVVFGPTKHFPSENLLLYFNNWPVGSSVYQFRHYLQIATTKKFQKYDYGRSDNLKKHGTENPPAYNLSQIKVPVAFYYGESDTLYSKEGFDREYNEFGSSKKYKYSIPLDQNCSRFNHIDFVFAEHVDKHLHPLLLKTINKFEH